MVNKLKDEKLTVINESKRLRKMLETNFNNIENKLKLKETTIQLLEEKLVKAAQERTELAASNKKLLDATNKYESKVKKADEQSKTLEKHNISLSDLNQELTVNIKVAKEIQNRLEKKNANLIEANNRLEAGINKYKLNTEAKLEKQSFKITELNMEIDVKVNEIKNLNMQLSKDHQKVDNILPPPSPKVYNVNSNDANKLHPGKRNSVKDKINFFNDSNKKK